MNIDNKFVIGKSDKSSDEYDTLIFVRRDIKHCAIPSFIKIIASFAFSESLIESILIPSQIERICEGAFYHCEQLKTVEFTLTSELRVIEKYSFTKTSNKEIVIPSTLT